MTMRTTDGRLARSPSLQSADRVRIIPSDRPNDARRTLLEDIRTGLGRTPRSIPPKYFYDERGSNLFDAICELPEYYLTRAERALLVRHAAGIVGATRATTLVEIGSGMARKTALLVEAIGRQASVPRYVPFDISPDALEASARSLLVIHPRLEVCGLVGDFGYDLPRLAIAAPASAGPRLFALLGSTMGNLDQRAAPRLLGAVRNLMTADDAFLLGIDLVKGVDRLHAAYNDARGLTAAFNKNVLRVLSRELDADFDEAAFDHEARYDVERQQIEMYLVSRRRQTATLRALPMKVELAAGERILTEISRKFTRDTVERSLQAGRMRLEDWFTDADGSFALALATRG